MWGTIKSIASGIWTFLKGVASVLWTVGTFLFTTIEKITSPDGWLAKAIIKGVKFFLFLKKTITELMKASGTSTIDAFCEFLAGDTIGIAIRMVGGLVVKAWKYISRVGIFRTFINVVKAVVGWSIMWGKLLFNCVTALPRLMWAAIKGNFVGCLNNLFVKPITDWWDMVTGVFKGSDAKVINVKENPIELNEDTATNAKTAIRGLKIIGKNGNNVAKEMDRL